MNVANVRKPIFKTMQNGCDKVVRESRAAAEVAKRAANIQKLSYMQKTYAKGKGYLIGGCKPVMNGVCNMSDNIKVIAETTKTVQKKIKKNAVSDKGKSNIKAAVVGIRDSAPEIKEALKEIIGIKDVKAATEHGGLLLGIKEAGKAVARVISSTALFIAGTFLPLPASSIAGWVAGEKMSNALFGKPFIKQIKKIIK